jgi:hypothetical protein
MGDPNRDSRFGRTPEDLIRAKFLLANTWNTINDVPIAKDDKCWLRGQVQTTFKSSTNRVPIELRAGTKVTVLHIEDGDAEDKTRRATVVGSGHRGYESIDEVEVSTPLYNLINTKTEPLGKITNAEGFELESQADTTKDLFSVLHPLFSKQSLEEMTPQAVEHYFFLLAFLLSKRGKNVFTVPASLFAATYSKKPRKHGPAVNVFNGFPLDRHTEESGSYIDILHGYIMPQVQAGRTFLVPVSYKLLKQKRYKPLIITRKKMYFDDSDVPADIVVYLREMLGYEQEFGKFNLEITSKNGSGVLCCINALVQFSETLWTAWSTVNAVHMFDQRYKDMVAEVAITLLTHSIAFPKPKKEKERLNVIVKYGVKDLLTQPGTLQAAKTRKVQEVAENEEKKANAIKKKAERNKKRSIKRAGEVKIQKAGNERMAKIFGYQEAGRRYADALKPPVTTARRDLYDQIAAALDEESEAVILADPYTAASTLSEQILWKLHGTYDTLLDNHEILEIQYYVDLCKEKVCRDDHISEIVKGIQKFLKNEKYFNTDSDVFLKKISTEAEKQAYTKNVNGALQYILLKLHILPDQLPTGTFDDLSVLRRIIKTERKQSILLKRRMDINACFENRYIKNLDKFRWKGKMQSPIHLFIKMCRWSLNVFEKPVQPYKALETILSKLQEKFAIPDALLQSLAELSLLTTVSNLYDEERFEFYARSIYALKKCIKKKQGPETLITKYAINELLYILKYVSEKWRDENKARLQASYDKECFNSHQQEKQEITLSEDTKSAEIGGITIAKEFENAKIITCEEDIQKEAEKKIDALLELVEHISNEPESMAPTNDVPKFLPQKDIDALEVQLTDLQKQLETNKEKIVQKNKRKSKLEEHKQKTADIKSRGSELPQDIKLKIDVLSKTTFTSGKYRFVFNVEENYGAEHVTTKLQEALQQLHNAEQSLSLDQTNNMLIKTLLYKYFNPLRNKITELLESIQPLAATSSTFESEEESAEKQSYQKVVAESDNKLRVLTDEQNEIRKQIEDITKELQSVLPTAAQSDEVVNSDSESESDEEEKAAEDAYRQWYACTQLNSYDLRKQIWLFTHVVKSVWQNNQDNLRGLVVAHASTFATRMLVALKQKFQVSAKTILYVLANIAPILLIDSESTAEVKQNMAKALFQFIDSSKRPSTDSLYQPTYLVNYFVFNVLANAQLLTETFFTNYVRITQETHAAELTPSTDELNVVVRRETITITDLKTKVAERWNAKNAKNKVINICGNEPRQKLSTQAKKSIQSNVRKAFEDIKKEAAEEDSESGDEIILEEGVAGQLGTSPVAGTEVSAGTELSDATGTELPDETGKAIDASLKAFQQGTSGFVPITHKDVLQQAQGRLEFQRTLPDAPIPQFNTKGQTASSAASSEEIEILVENARKKREAENPVINADAEPTHQDLQDEFGDVDYGDEWDYDEHIAGLGLPYEDPKSS